MDLDVWKVKWLYNKQFETSDLIMKLNFGIIEKNEESSACKGKEHYMSDKGVFKETV